MSRRRARPSALPPWEEPAPNYPEYDAVREEARRTLPRFIHHEAIAGFSAVVSRRGTDWCTAVLGHDFYGVSHTGVTECQMLVVADRLGLAPELPEPVVEAIRAAREHEEEMAAARRRLQDRDVAAWEAAFEQCSVPVEVRENTRGRRTNVGGLDGPLRHVVPLHTVRSGRNRVHRAGRAVCEQANRPKPRVLSDPVDRPATCKACLARTPNLEPITLRAGEPLVRYLRGGINWLSMAQPDGAIKSHHGIYGGSWDGRVSVRVIAESGSPGKTPAVVFQVLYVDRDVEGRPVNAFTMEEVSALNAAVSAIAPVVDSWNGIGCTSLTIAFRMDLSDSLRRARDAYDGDGCPEHGSMFCHSNGSNCTWLRDGEALVHYPRGWR